VPEVENELGQRRAQRHDSHTTKLAGGRDGLVLIAASIAAEASLFLDCMKRILPKLPDPAGQ